MAAHRSESFLGAFSCPGTTTRWDYRFEGRVSGGVSSDGQTLTAKEVWSYTLTTGEEAALHLDWIATRQLNRSCLSFEGRGFLVWVLLAQAYNTSVAATAVKNCTGGVA
jgi:hypothetical protein